MSRGSHVLSSWLPWPRWLHFLNTTQPLPAFFPSCLSPSPSLTFFPFLISCKHRSSFPTPVWQTGTAHMRVLAHRSPYMLSFKGSEVAGKTQENTLSRTALSCDRRRKGRRSVRTQDREDRWFEGSVKGVIHTQMERRGGVRQLTPTISRQQERLGANFSRHAKAK